MKFSLKPRLAVAGLAVAALVMAAPAAANAAPTPSTQPNGSSYPVYIVDPDSGLPAEDVLGPGPIPWLRQIAFSSVPDDSAFNPDNAFPAGSDTDTVFFFLSAPGNERNRSMWIGEAIMAGAPINGGVWLATTGLAYLNDGDAPGNVTDVEITGGTYSFGFAFRTIGGLQPAALTGAYVTIHVEPGTGAWTFEAPATVEAPAITTQPAAQSVNIGGTATFTAAASGSPAPTVQWESAAAGSSTFAPVAGATSTTLTVANATEAQSGTQYRAVFTNSAGSATTDPATLTVSRVAPEKPVSGDANEVAIAAPAAGATTVTVSAGAANANKTLTAWAWSDAVNLGQVTTDANGDATVDLSSLPKGTHTVALAEANFDVVTWGTVTLTQADWGAGDPATDSGAEVDLSATITTSNRFELQSSATSVNLGSVRRGQTTEAVALGGVKVIDDRDNRRGWTLAASATQFTNSARNDTAPASALSISPKAVGTLPAGIALGAGGDGSAAVLATGAADSFTDEAGIGFDADLTFAAPAGAKAGEYTSVLTVTLVSE